MKANKDTYSQFLLSTFGRHSLIWLSRLLDNQPAHDSWNRWLSSVKLKPSLLWEDTKDLVDLSGGYLIVDDSVLDKWYASKIELAQSQYSGTHHRLVRGIGLVNLVWTSDQSTQKQEHIACDFRLFAPKFDGLTKHHHAQDMLESALLRGFDKPTVLMDSWYASSKTLKWIDRELNWQFIAAIAKNRQVKTDPNHSYRQVTDMATDSGIKCWMKGYGHVKAFRFVRPQDGDTECLVTNDLSLPAPVARSACECRWRVEELHRGIKQVTGVESCQARSQRSQRNHILCSIRALMSLEQWRLDRQISWYEAKQQLIVEALSQYLKDPFIPLPQAANR